MAFEKIIKNSTKTVNGISIGKTGSTTISAKLYESLGKPKFIAFMVDLIDIKIGIIPSTVNDPHAYSIRPNNPRKDGTISSYNCMCIAVAKKFNCEKTLYFPNVDYSISEEAWIGKGKTR